MKHISWLFIFLFLNVCNSISQVPFSHSVYKDWKLISKTIISDDGKWISYEINPQHGDGFLFLKNPSSYYSDSIARGTGAGFNAGNNFIAFKISPPLDTVRKAKLAGKKDDEIPGDSLGIWLLKKDTIFKWPGLKSFKIPAEKSQWIAFQLKKTEKSDKLNQKSDTSELKEKNENQNNEEKEKKSSAKKKKKKKDVYDLYVMNPVSGKMKVCGDVSDYVFSRNGNTLLYNVCYGDSVDSCSLICYFTLSGDSAVLFNGPGKIAKITVDSSGRQFAFLYSSDTSKNKNYNLCYRNLNEKSCRNIVDTSALLLPHGLKASENGNIYFSLDGKRLFFGMASPAEKEIKDTLPEDEKVNLDIWSWTDGRLQSQQIKELKDDQQKTLLAVCDLTKYTVIPLADSTVTDITLQKNGDGDFAIGRNDKPYQKQYSWEGNESYDIYLVNVKTGSKQLVLKDIKNSVSLSPNGKYIIYYNAEDSLWYSMSTATKTSVKLKGPANIVFADEENDVPALPDAYGIAGWTKNDKFVIIYDRYDLWKFDPEGKIKPVCITGAYGRKNNIRFRYVKLNNEMKYIDDSNVIFLEIFDEKSCENGYYSLNPSENTIPANLLTGPYKFSNIVKAKKSNELIYQRMSFSEFPDIWCSDTTFKNPSKLSFAGNQAASVLWGSVELVSWTDYNGNESKGLLYKPANLDTTKKYPMIVYFYEKHSEELYQFYNPGPSRSVISPSFYTSNGYAVFMPDIKYRKGFPGESCYDAVLSGTVSMVNKYPWINKERLGLQGQSWGGYQVAYLVTRTNMYKAAMAGAPVSNMVSAYGAIRGESGISRMFQYEKSQSRIGKTLWEAPMLYIENSPVFHADKVNTPLLIMANDGDGAVPWQQGIELFTALRRLNKPAWLLNYNNDMHNLMKWPNRVDLSIRMNQFFDVYLKDTPAPLWIKQGIPALQKGKVTGY